MNINSKFQLSQLIIDNILLACRVRCVKHKLVTIQDFRYIDYVINPNLLIQLYYAPRSVREANAKKGINHHHNRAKVLLKRSIETIPLHVEDCIFDFPTTEEYLTVALEQHKVIKPLYTP